LATTLGVAVATQHVALVLIGRRRTETVTLDQVLLDADASTMAPPADVRLLVLAEVKRIIAVLDAHKRPLSHVAVTATEPAAARTAARIVEALTRAGVRNARAFALEPSGHSLVNSRAGNNALPSGLEEGRADDAAVTAAHEIALEALALASDASGRALSSRKRHAIALAATALATIGVGLIGFRSLPDQPRPEVTPVEATDPVPAQVTHRADPPPTTSAVNTETSPTAVVDTTVRVPAPAEQAEVAAPSTTAPTAAPTENSPPSSVEPTGSAPRTRAATRDAIAIVGRTTRAPTTRAPTTRASCTYGPTSCRASSSSAGGSAGKPAIALAPTSARRTTVRPRHHSPSNRPHSALSCSDRVE
jgi:hypothetical protein